MLISGLLSVQGGLSALPEPRQELPAINVEFLDADELGQQDHQQQTKHADGYHQLQGADRILPDHSCLKPLREALARETGDYAYHQDLGEKANEAGSIGILGSAS
jgi:hypothetical protein